MTIDPTKEYGPYRSIRSDGSPADATHPPKVGRMTIDEIASFIESLGDVAVQKAVEGDGTPEIAWGDSFFYYSPDGTIPDVQPFATITTKDYPDEPPSGLNAADAFRINLSVGKDEFVARIGRDPKAPADDLEPLSATDDVLFAHPTYGTLGWLSVKNPGPATEADLRDLMALTHGLAKVRYDRRN